MTDPHGKSARERHDDVKAACGAALRKRENEAFQEESKLGVWTASAAPADSTRWSTEGADPVADLKATIKRMKEWTPPPSMVHAVEVSPAAARDILSKLTKSTNPIAFLPLSSIAITTNAMLPHGVAVCRDSKGNVIGLINGKGYHKIEPMEDLSDAPG